MGGEYIQDKWCVGRGDLYHVDSAVTGSNYGTPYEPKWPLLPTFVETIIPMIEYLVSPSFKYEIYTPLFQGDNAGPHINAANLSGVKGYCEIKRWNWGSKASQMPHMNVISSSGFPYM